MGTFLGKSLVILNLIGSIAFATLAFAIFANRLSWGGTANDQIKGAVTAKKQEYEESLKGIDDVYRRSEDAKAKLLELEKKRLENLAWYKEKLAELQTGKEVLSIKYLDGKLVEDAQGRPQLEDQYKASQVGSLQSLQKVDQARTQTEKNIEKAQKSIEELIEREKDLTEEMNGRGDKFLGLRALLKEEELAERNALAEAEYLKPLRVNRQAEADLLTKRNQALHARVAELQK